MYFNLFQGFVMDEKFRKKALRMFSYGVYILISKFEDNYCAATVTWVSQASFEPPLISICIKGDSVSYAGVKERDEFLLHISRENQKDFATSFFEQTTLGNGLINEQDYHLQDNLPSLAAGPAYLKCKVIEIVEKGDYPLFLAEVKNALIQKTFKPLELRTTGWNYGG